MDWWAVLPDWAGNLAQSGNTAGGTGAHWWDWLEWGYWWGWRDWGEWCTLVGLVGMGLLVGLGGLGMF